jgi:Sigma-70 region 2
MNETGSHGERQARQFTELFTANYGAVLAYVQRRVGTDLAQDVVADTFLAAWRNIHELPPDPLPWLYRAAHFAVANIGLYMVHDGHLDAVIVNPRTLCLHGRAVDWGPGASPVRRAARPSRQRHGLGEYRDLEFRDRQPARPGAVMPMAGAAVSCRRSA